MLWRQQKDITVVEPTWMENHRFDAGKLTLHWIKLIKWRNDERLVISSYSRGRVEKYRLMGGFKTDFWKSYWWEYRKDEASKPAGRKTFGNNVDDCWNQSNAGQWASTMQAKQHKGVQVQARWISINPETRSGGAKPVRCKAIAQNAVVKMPEPSGAISDW